MGCVCVCGGEHALGESAVLNVVVVIFGGGEVDRSDDAKMKRQ